MRQLMNALRYLPKRTSALIAMFAAAIIVPSVIFAWGPDRPTYTIAHPADHITFNSITDNPNIGDERNFVGIREEGSTDTWNDTISAQPGKSYVVRMYVHNNAAANLNLVAKDVTAKFNLPTATGKSLQVDGFLSASNATPKEVYDHATFTANENFNLNYQEGTLKYYNNHFGSAGATIGESVFTSAGAKLGYNKLDGNIPGCFQYAGYLTFVVKPQFASTQTDFTIQKDVRKDGTSTWNNTVDAKAGDTLNYRLVYKNTGTTKQNNVSLKDKLPTGISYVPNSAKIVNASNPSGAVIEGSDKLFSTGVNIGNYTAGSNAIVVFSAKVTNNDALPKCGSNILKNVASAQPEGQSPKEDDATTNVPKECQPTPQPEYKCDSLTVTKISRTQFSFDTKYTVKDATYKSTTYVIRDASGKEISRSTNKTFTTDKVGKYTVEAIVTVTVNDTDKTVTSENCKKEFEVTPVPVTPAYACESLTATKINRAEYSFTGKATATNGATIVSYTFDFGDGNTKTVTNPTTTHAYSQAKDYTIKMSVTVKVDGGNKTVTSDACKTQITVSPEKPEECKPGIPVGDPRCEEKPPVEECKPGIPVGDERCEEKCDVPGKEHLPKDSPDCKETPVTPETPETPQTPAELPKTGVANTILTLMGAGSLIAAISYYVASRRALG